MSHSSTQAAQAITKLSEVLGESLASYYNVLLQFLMKEITSRLWEVENRFIFFFNKQDVLRTIPLFETFLSR